MKWLESIQEMLCSLFDLDFLFYLFWSSEVTGDHHNLDSPIDIITSHDHAIVMMKESFRSNDDDVDDIQVSSNVQQQVVHVIAWTDTIRTVESTDDDDDDDDDDDQVNYGYKALFTMSQSNIGNDECNTNTGSTNHKQTDHRRRYYGHSITSFLRLPLHKLHSIHDVSTPERNDKSHFFQSKRFIRLTRKKNFKKNHPPSDNNKYPTEDTILTCCKDDIGTTETTDSSYMTLENEATVVLEQPHQEQKVQKQSFLYSFHIRLQDLNVDITNDISMPSSLSSSSSISSLPSIFERSPKMSMNSKYIKDEDKLYFLHVDHSNISLALNSLVQYGHQILKNCATNNKNQHYIDYQPTRETQRLLILQQKQTEISTKIFDVNHVYTWVGTKQQNTTLASSSSVSSSFSTDVTGNDWPITKVRAIISNTTSNQLVQFLLDSSQVKSYNNISLGREDVMVWHNNKDTKTNHNDTCISSNGMNNIDGTLKIVRGKVQPKLFPKIIETFALMYAVAVPDDVPDTYMIVCRSIYEDEEKCSDTKINLSSSSCTHNSQNTIRSETKLVIYYVRPIHIPVVNNSSSKNCTQRHTTERCCELITITHIVSSGVPEIIAKRMLPQSATNMVYEIQNIFLKSQ
jgi:hypothetical protein